MTATPLAGLAAGGEAQFCSASLWQRELGFERAVQVRWTPSHREPIQRESSQVREQNSPKALLAMLLVKRA
eukprot:3331368-Amphidinium_carterae.1